MKMKKLVSAALFLILSFIILVSCNNIRKSGTKTIAFVSQALNSSAYWDDVNAKLKKEIESQGYKYLLSECKDWRAESQAKIIDELVKKKVDVIIIPPCGTEPLFESFKKANDAGIEIILVDSDMDREYLDSYGIYVTTFVGIDNYKCGQMVGNAVVKELPKGSDVAIFSGEVNSENGEARTDGFSDVMKENGMNIISRTAVNWSADDAYAKAKIVFKAYPDIKAVFSVNSSTNSGVYKAAEEYGLEIIGGSFDTDDEVLKRIQTGEVICTLDQDSSAMAKKVGEVVNKLMNNEKVEPVVESEGKLITK